MPLLDHKKAMEQGLISKKQMEKLPPHLVDAIIKSKMNNKSTKNRYICHLWIHK